MASSDEGTMTDVIKDPINDRIVINALTRCETILKLLNSESDNDGFWTGFLTNRFKELGYSNPHYGETMTYLMDMGCVEQIRKGAGRTPSIWRVNRHDIDRESFITLYRERLSSKENKVTLGKRVDILEDKVDQLVKLFNSMMGNTVEQSRRDDVQLGEPL